VSWTMMDEGSQFDFRVLRKVAGESQYAELACEISGQNKERVFPRRNGAGGQDLFVPRADSRRRSAADVVRDLHHDAAL